MEWQPTARCRRFGRQFRRLLPSLVLLGAVALPVQSAAQDAPARIAYVDMQRLIDSAPQVLSAKARLRGEFADRDRALDTDTRQLAALDDRIRREADLMSRSDADALKSEAEALRNSIQRTRDRLAEELNNRIDQELDQAWPDIEATVADYARESGFDLVVSSPVVYASGRIDITDRVLDRLRRTAEQSR